MLLATYRHGIVLNACFFCAGQNNLLNIFHEKSIKTPAKFPAKNFPDFFIPVLEALPKMSKKERAHLDLVTWIYH